jgi:tellurite resistance protein
MNTKAQIALTSFVSDFDEFIAACSELERMGVWNVEERGLMSAYFETDLFAVVLQTMSADGVFERAEADVLNQMFSTSYTPRELNDMYRSLGSVVDDYCDADAADAVALLSGIDAELCERYRQLIIGACQVVSLADGVAEGDERVLLERLRIALEG